jgi:hypothetical protein
MTDDGDGVRGKKCCVACKRTDGDIDFQCAVCKAWYHKDELCSGVNAIIVKTASQTKQIQLLCVKCKDIDFGSLLLELQMKVKRLEENGKPAITNTDATTEKIEEVVEELLQRRDRRDNLIIFGIPESTKTTIKEKIQDDKNKIKRIAEQIGCQNLNLQLMSRIGKPAHNPTKPRPLIIKCANRAD